MHRLGEKLQHLHGLGGERPRLRELLAECREVVRAWELTVPEEAHHFLERGVAREVLDRVSLIGETPVDAVQITEPRGGGDDPLETSDQPTVGSGHATAFLGEGVRLSPDGSAGSSESRRATVITGGSAGSSRRGQAPTIRSTVFWIWVRSTGFEIIEKGPISSALAIMSESG